MDDYLEEGWDRDVIYVGYRRLMYNTCFVFGEFKTAAVCPFS